MRLERILRAVYTDVWLITPAKHQQICKLLDLKLHLSKQEFQARERSAEVSGEKVQLDSMTIEDGIARIPFAGVLVKGAGSWEKYAGAISHDDIMADISEAIETRDVKAIMFDVDSPGGTAAGSFDLADLVAAASQIKPTLAWVEGLCCSAAYLSLAGCTMIYGNRSCEVGAVETYLALLDSSEAYEKAGVKVDIIKSGDHVAAGYPGTSLTPDQRAVLQEQVDDIFRQYVEHLEDVRPQLSHDDFDGRTFIGRVAKDHKFVDSITSKTQALSDLRQLARM